MTIVCIIVLVFAVISLAFYGRTKRFPLLFPCLKTIPASILLQGILILHGPLPLGATELKIYTENMPPYNYENPVTRRAQGFSVDILKEMLKRTGITPEDNSILVLPWARGYRLVQKQKNTLLFSMTKTTERTPLFKWVGPLAKRQIWLWKKKTRADIVVTSIDEAKQYSVGGVYDFASSQWLRQQGFRVEMTPSIIQNWRKLFLTRIDMVSALELEAAFNMKTLGIPFDALERLIPIDSRYDYYFALNRETGDWIVMKLQQALDEMKSDGTYDTLRLKYLN